MEVLLINPPERFDESNENLKKNKGVIPCLKIKDSVKSINTNKRIKNLNRKQINITQTPQGFRFGEI